MTSKTKKTVKKRILNHLGRVSLAVITVILMTPPAIAVEPVDVVGQTLGNDGGKIATKEAINAALKAARSKPAMTVATGIVCISCIPVGGAAASPGMCIACGILIAKTFG